MTHNTMKRRLSRCYKLTPREARLLLRSSNYDYNLVESVLIQRGLKSCRLSVDDISKAIQVFTNMVKAFAEACSAFGKTFSEEMNRDE